MHTLKPINSDPIKNELKNKKAIFTLEEHTILGGLGTIIAEIILVPLFPKNIQKIWFKR